MKPMLGLFGAIMLACLSFPADAQAPPPGSYQQSCRHIRMHGTTLTAVCRRAKNRGEQTTSLNVAHCVGDIGNNNGVLQCSGGRPAPPPRQAAPDYRAPGYPPPLGYRGPGYGSPPRYAGEESYREHCQRLRYEERELRDRLAHTPHGRQREKLQYRLGQVHNERERCRHR